MTISPKAAALAVLGAALAYSLAPILLGLDAILARTPDDAFYYLLLAKNFAASGTWTFDGQNAATGFHLMFGYLLAGIYRLAPGIAFVEIYAVVSVLNALLLAGAVLMLASACRDAFGPRAGLGVLLVGLSAGGLQLAAFPMESCLVVLFAALSVYLVAPGRPAGGNPAGAALAALLTGIAGVFARSDYALLPFALLFGILAHALWHRRWPGRTLAVPVALCLGAVVGVALVTLHTYAFTGGFVQRSASIKHFWASVSGYTPMPGLARVVELFQPYAVPRMLVPALLGLAFLWLALRRRLGLVLDNPLTLAAGAVILGYGAAYALNGAVQYWYAATFYAAAAILAAALAVALPVRGRAVVAGLIALYGVSAVMRFMNPPWPWQSATMQAGLMLRDDPKLAPVAAWNAGVVAFFAGRPVTNLDGLVNDSVYPAVVSGRLAEYVDGAGIAYIVDFPTMFQGMGGARGGYADGALARCARPLRTVAPNLTFEGAPLTLFRVERPCAGAPAREQTARANP